MNSESRLPDSWAATQATGPGAPSGAFQGDRPVGSLKLPENIDQSGLLVGWSLEMEHARRPLGFSFGDPAKTPSTGYIDPILMEKDGHLITIAPTGAGKGVGCIVPALLRYEGPIIVIDPKGENVAITARRRREMGHEVVVLDPIRITDQPAASLNPLDMLDVRSATTVDEVAAMASILTAHPADEEDRFWYERAAHLIMGIILHALADHSPKDRNLTMVRNLLGLASSDPDKLITAMRQSVHPEVRAVIDSVSVGAPETRASIMAVAQDGVDFLRGTLVQEATKTTTFKLEDVTLGKPLSIYLVLPPHMLESHGKLLRMWIATLMMAITRRRRRAAQPTLFLLDEAAQLGSLPQLRQAITLLRGYGLRTWSFWQDLSQLRQLYPLDWQTMVNNCQVLQCFGTFNGMAAEGVAALTGFGTPAAVMELDDNEMILQISGDQPVIARVPSYRTDPPFNGLFDPNPFFSEAQDILPKELPRIRLYKRPAAPKRAAKIASVVISPKAEPPEEPQESSREEEDPFLERLIADWDKRDASTK